MNHHSLFPNRRTRPALRKIWAISNDVGLLLTLCCFEKSALTHSRGLTLQKLPSKHRKYFTWLHFELIADIRIFIL